MPVLVPLVPAKLAPDDEAVEVDATGILAFATDLSKVDKSPDVVVGVDCVCGVAVVGCNIGTGGVGGTG